MKRRKLTAAEVASIEVAKNALRMVPDDVIDEDVIKVISLLREVERHRTTDGKPYVEPQPEIGDGYRRATEADKDRRDRDYWKPQGLIWVPASTGMYSGNYTYRVPVDRVPTDEDAVGRPIVMVRHCGEMPWRTIPLVAVVESDRPFIALQGTVIWRFQEARFPYPGELD